MNFVRLFVNSKGYSSVSEYYSGHVLMWVASLKKRKDVLDVTAALDETLRLRVV